MSFITTRLFVIRLNFLPKYCSYCNFIYVFFIHGAKIVKRILFNVEVSGKVKRTIRTTELKWGLI